VAALLIFSLRARSDEGPRDSTVCSPNWYLLTNDERFLQPYREGQDQAPKLKDELRWLISDNPEQQARNEEAIQAQQQWQAFADRVLAMARVGFFLKPAYWTYTNAPIRKIVAWL
jgi:CHASE3 domain